MVLTVWANIANSDDLQIFNLGFVLKTRDNFLRFFYDDVCYFSTSCLVFLCVVDCPTGRSNRSCWCWPTSIYSHTFGLRHHFCPETWSASVNIYITWIVLKMRRWHQFLSLLHIFEGHFLCLMPRYVWFWKAYSGLTFPCLLIVCILIFQTFNLARSFDKRQEDMRISNCSSVKVDSVHVMYCKISKLICLTGS